MIDVLITHVYDKCRFGYYMEAKFQMYKSAAITMANDINHGYFVKLCKLPECDVRYLQRPNLQYTEHFCAINKPICDLKILNNKVINLSKIPLKRKPNIPPYLDNEGKLSESIDITASCDNERQCSSFELYSVTYTKIIENKEALNIHQITALLNDPNVKSINIKK